MLPTGELTPICTEKPETCARNEILHNSGANGLSTPPFLYNTKHLPISAHSDSPQHVLRRDVDWRFGLKLRTLRRQRQWTQSQMAGILGINRSYISEIERGHKSVTLGMLEVIALGLQMSIAELLYEV
ncbi:MAG TPA: helix-turn-helix transcriptional regulator [Acidobacteriaceae bacterium]|nr:helix-turn-helix transcriptional regulator [Acidobacteriaceae bacterium]